MKNTLLFIKSIFIGIFMLVPGISGGTLAIIFGIYEELLSKLSHLFKDLKNNFTYLFIALLGGVLGVYLSSFFLKFLIENFLFELIFIFIGIMLFYIFKTIKISLFNPFKKILYTSIGLVIGYLISLVPIGFITNENNIIILLLLGIFLAIALILPGISVSYVFLVFGMYDDIILAINHFDILYLLKVGTMLLVGMLLVVKGLSYLIKKKENEMEFIIIGFIICSVIKVIPNVTNISEIIYASIFILCGIFINSLINLKK